MEIYILTYGRPDDQRTWRNLPREIQRRTKLVVQGKEYNRGVYNYHKGGIFVLPMHVKNLPATRQHILSIAKNKVILLDDDLCFNVRREDDKGKFLNPTDKDIIDLFAEIDIKLSSYAHVGVLAREGGNRIQEPVVFNTRMMRILAYRADIVKKAKIAFDERLCQEDFDVCLKLLKKGYANAVLCNWVQGQVMSGAAGGYSDVRTKKRRDASVKLFAKLHTPFVKVVEKTTKHAWGGGVRLDVQVAWKKAYASSQL